MNHILCILRYLAEQLSTGMMLGTEPEVILVDQDDNETGTCGKMEAHSKGLLHRAFSVFIFNGRGELLIQRRALGKYHSGGLWTNTCCSHPVPGEQTIQAAHSRLSREMGLTCDLEFAFTFTYRAEMDQGLIEHEFDHVFFGRTDAEPRLNPEEAMDWKYIDPDGLSRALETHPAEYSAWLGICWSKVRSHLAGKL
jgi:isopentenyl-diphosphate delta-isomerase